MSYFLGDLGSLSLANLGVATNLHACLRSVCWCLFHHKSHRACMAIIRTSAETLTCRTSAEF